MPFLKDIATLDSKIESTKKELRKDIEITKSELKKEIKLNIAQLETKIEQGKNTVIMWLVGLLSPLYIGVVIVLVRWLVQS